MPWDIPETITTAINALRQWMYLKSPEQQSKKLDNQKRKDDYDAKREWLSFSARMRRFLAGRKVIVFPLTLMLLLVASCAHQSPMTDDERAHMITALEACQREKSELLSNLLECLDRGDELSECEPTPVCY